MKPGCFIFVRDDVSLIEPSFGGACLVPAGNEQELMDSVNKQCILCHTKVLQVHQRPSFIKQIILSKPVTFCTSVWLLQMQHEMFIL